MDCIEEVKSTLEGNNFVDLSQDMALAESDMLKRTGQTLMTYGVPFLDDALRGLANDEVVLLGAPSGVGKTEYCIRIALENVKRGYNVHFYSLESSRHEIGTRFMYMNVASMFFKDPDRPKIDNLNYLDFYYGKYGSLLDKYKERLFKYPNIKKLKIYYKSKSFGIKEFLTSLEGISKKTDLIILDHLHYFDMQTDNENREMKEIIKKIRHRSQVLNKPIILIAHLRKKDSRVKRLVAALEDFHGSSDIGKIATTAIILGPGKSLGSGNFETFFRIVKCRKDGSLKYFTIMNIYNKYRNAYADEYKVGREKWTSNGVEFEPINNNLELPKWAPPISVSSNYNGLQSKRSTVKEVKNYAIKSF